MRWSGICRYSSRPPLRSAPHSWRPEGADVPSGRFHSSPYVCHSSPGCPLRPAHQEPAERSASPAGERGRAALSVIIALAQPGPRCHCSYAMDAHTTVPGRPLLLTPVGPRPTGRYTIPARAREGLTHYWHDICSLHEATYRDDGTPWRGGHTERVMQRVGGQRLALEASGAGGRVGSTEDREEYRRGRGLDARFRWDRSAGRRSAHWQREGVLYALAPGPGRGRRSKGICGRCRPSILRCGCDTG